MSIKTIYLRSEKYLRRHGLKASIKRIWKEGQDRIFHNRDILFCRDLVHGDFMDQDVPESCKVEIFERRADLPEGLFKQMSEFYSEELLQDYVRDRFEKGARLWWLRNDIEGIGYTWTLTGRTMKPYYFPLMERDLYLFDAMIFPHLRRLGMNNVLLNHILKHYQAEGFHRAYLETREWNIAVVKLMLKNEFTRIGIARKKIRGRRCKVTWWLEDDVRKI